MEKDPDLEYVEAKVRAIADLCTEYEKAFKKAILSSIPFAVENVGFAALSRLRNIQSMTGGSVGNVGGQVVFDPNGHREAVFAEMPEVLKKAPDLKISSADGKTICISSDPKSKPIE